MQRSLPPGAEPGAENNAGANKPRKRGGKGKGAKGVAEEGRHHRALFRV